MLSVVVICCHLLWFWLPLDYGSSNFSKGIFLSEILIILLWLGLKSLSRDGMSYSQLVMKKPLLLFPLPSSQISECQYHGSCFRLLKINEIFMILGFPAAGYWMGLHDVAAQYLPLLSSTPGSTEMHLNLLVRLLLFSVLFFPVRQQNSVSSNEMRAIISSNG